MPKSKSICTTISLTFETKKELEAIGKKGQSFDELIKELIQLKKGAK